MPNGTEPTRKINARPNNIAGRGLPGDPPMRPMLRRATIAWGEIDLTEIGKFVSRVCDSGRGLVLGKTSDGGALSITILDGNERIREYPTTVGAFEEISAWCEANI